MKTTTISSTLFIVSGVTIRQAYEQVPTWNEWGIEMIYENALDRTWAKRYAWAIYRKECFLKPEDEISRRLLALQLQWMYDHAKELQVEE